MVIICVFISSINSQAQNSLPYFKLYSGSKPGYNKYYNFNILKIKLEEGNNVKRAAGEYWDQNFLMDTLKTDNYKLKDYFLEQLKELNANLHLQDEKNIYFSFVSENEYYWGRFFSKEYFYSYRILLIRENPIERKIRFNSEDPIIYDEYLAEMPTPPVIRPIYGSVAVTGKYSKYNNLIVKYKENEKRYEKSAGGKFWDYKFEIRNKVGKRDVTVSSFEIKENFYREIFSLKGNIVHDLGPQLIFSIPADDYTVWCRLVVLKDGQYKLNIVQEMNKDSKAPVQIR